MKLYGIFYLTILHSWEIRRITQWRVELPNDKHEHILFQFTDICGGEESTTILWKYSQTSDFTTIEELTATYSSSETGLSWLDVDNSKQGYYQCQIGNGIRYIIGLYDQTITTGMLPLLIVKEM